MEGDSEGGFEEALETKAGLQVSHLRRQRLQSRWEASPVPTFHLLSDSTSHNCRAGGDRWDQPPVGDVRQLSTSLDLASDL